MHTHENTPPGRAGRRKKLLPPCAASACVLLALLLTTGSLLFKAMARCMPPLRGCTLHLGASGIRPLGFFRFGSWELRKGGRLVFQGRRLTGRCALSPLFRFRLAVAGREARSGPAFPELFPAHNETIPEIALRGFDFQASGRGPTRRVLRESLCSRLDLDVVGVSLESSRFCRKIQEATGIRIQRYLRFHGGEVLLTQRRGTVSIRTPRPLDGPYQVLDLDGSARLADRGIHLKMNFGLQPRLARKLRNERFFKPFIAGDWDGKSVVMLPAPVILSGTIGEPRIDVGRLIERDPGAGKGGGASGEARGPRVHLRLKRDPADGRYRLAAPSGPGGPAGVHL